MTIKKLSALIFQKFPIPDNKIIIKSSTKLTNKMNHVSTP